MPTVRQLDPSRTSGIRNRFVADMTRRIKNLRRDIRVSIITNDCFGIQPLHLTLQRAMSAANVRQFAFERDTAAKVAAFIKWLEEQEAAGILQIIRRPGSGISIMGGWTDVYIQNAYRMGLSRAQTEMLRMGLEVQGTSSVPGRDAASSALNLPVHADRVAALYTRTFEDLKTVMSAANADIRRKLIDGLTTNLSAGMARGDSPLTIARAIANDTASGLDKIGMNRARMIARTEVIRAHHLGTVNEYRRADAEMNVRVEVEFKTAEDASVCPECEALDGKIFTLDEIEGVIPVHPNCVVGDTIILAPDIKAAVSANYSGEIAKIVFSGGQRLSVTPNHMLLTPHGFIPAKFLSEGDTVLCGTIPQPLVSEDPNNDRNPARIDQIVKSLAESAGVTTRCMPVTAEDLHGDGNSCEGNVDVVFADGELGDKFNFTLQEQINECQLDGRGIFDILFGDGTFSEFLERAFLTPDSIMGGSREILALIRGHLRMAEKHGFASISDREAKLLESCNDDISCTAEIARHLLNRRARIIHLSDLRNIYIEAITRASADVNPVSTSENSRLDGVSFGDPIASSEITKGFAGKISTVSIVSIELEHVTNLPVYDITSTATVYLANGIVSSNCRCTALPVIQQDNLTGNRRALARVA